MTQWDAVALGGGAASSGLTYPLPAGERNRIRSLAFEVDCTGGGSARQVIVQLKDGTGATVYGVAAPDTQASGATVTYAFAEDLVASGTSLLGFQQGPFVGGWLPGNLSIVISVVSAGGSDTITNVRLMVGQRPVSEPHGEPV